MTLAHRMELDPTVKQREYFARAGGTAGLVWNGALARWNAEYEAGAKPKASDLKRRFNRVKYQQFPWLTNIHRDAHAQPFADLSKAFRNFFAGRARHPRFNKKGKCRDSYYIANDKFSVNGSSVRLPMIGSVRMTEALRFTGKIQSAMVNRDADRWFIAISVEIPDPKPSRPQGKPMGVDLGLPAFATLSTGQKIQAPKPLQRALRKLRRLGRWHSGKPLQSRNRAQASRKLARQHRRIRNIRNDFLQKLSTDLAKTHSAIGIEDLRVKGMLQNRRLALHLSDAAWSEFGRPWKYKTALYGSTLTVPDCWYASSKTCSAGGQKRSSLELSERSWSCEQCGTTHDRDVNAAINLKPDTAGYAEIHACGEVGAVRPLVETGTLPYAHLCAQER